jgi:hypothetical protein
MVAIPTVYCDKCGASSDKKQITVYNKNALCASCVFLEGMGVFYNYGDRKYETDDQSKGGDIKTDFKAN